MAFRDEPPSADVAGELLDYLRERPNAADTLDGIMNWWLPRQRYETERRKVEQALDELVARGLVVKNRLDDGTVLYSRGKPDPSDRGRTPH